MKIIRGIDRFPILADGCVLTIGNFDGVHRGHQKIIKQLLNHAKGLQLPSVVMLFEPQPLEFFLRENAPVRLGSFREKVMLLDALGVDYLLLVHFNHEVANLSRRDFLQEYIVEKLHVKQLIVGDDFHFGKNRLGDYHYLCSVSLSLGFQVEETTTLRMPSVDHKDARRVSSSWVREAIQANDFQMVEQLLGRPYTICGHVAHGDKRGRRLGYPTVNIYLKHDLSLITGIYVVKVLGVKNKPLLGVASIGRRPTFGGKRLVLEVFILDFDEMIYGRFIRVEFFKKLREELKFDNVDDLVAQMAQDVKDARHYFKIENR